MAIGFKLPGGRITDIVANSQNGFPRELRLISSGSSELFRQRTRCSETDAVREFSGHASQHGKIPFHSQSSARELCHLCVARQQHFHLRECPRPTQAIRYQIVALAGKHGSGRGSDTASNFLFDELRARISKTPVEFLLQAQLAEPGDPTHDATLVWPDDRKKGALGTIRLTSVDPRSGNGKSDDLRPHTLDRRHRIVR
jgi:catalase